MRKFFKYLVYCVGTLLLVAALVVAFNFNYMQRYYTSFKTDTVLDTDWFKPTVELLPSASVAELSRSKSSLASAVNGFDKAINYAAEMESSVLLVWHQGELVLEKYWPGYDVESYYQTHSIHKSLLALAVGVAVNDGDIASINDPVSNYIGDWVEQPLGNITIENLLTMSAGLDSPAFIPLPFTYSNRLLNSANISDVARERPQTSAPGEKFHYANAVPQIMVDVLEAATGVSYEVYLQDKLWSKFAAHPAKLWMDREDGTPHGFCCLISRADDLLRLGLLVMNEGEVEGQQVVAREWIQAATKPSKANPNYGYYTWLGNPYSSLRTYSPGASFGVTHSAPYIADDVIFFDGFGGQRVYIVPSQELVIVRVGKVRFDFDDAILPNHIIAAIRAAEEKSAKQDTAAGTYQVDHADLTMIVASDSTTAREVDLQVSYPIGGGDFPLILFSHGQYLDNRSYKNLTDYWVSAGYVVVAPKHLDAGDISAVNALTKEVGSDWMIASRLLDLNSASDQIGQLMSTVDNFTGDVDTRHIVAAGHSLGALSSQYLAGATPELQGNSAYTIPDNLNNDKVRAVVAVSPPGLIPNYLTEATWQGFATPQLVVTGTQDFFPQIWPNYQDHFVSYETAEAGANYLLVLDGMDHYFGNLLGRLDRDAVSQTLALSNLKEVSLRLINRYLHTAEDTVEPLNEFEEISIRPGVLQYKRR